MRGNGGTGGNRTLDLRIANATLSHLSYSPTTGRRAGEAASAWEPWRRSPRETGGKRADNVEKSGPCQAAGAPGGLPPGRPRTACLRPSRWEIGRASRRGRVCKSVWIRVVVVSVKQKTKER